MAKRVLNLDELILSIHTAALAADGWTCVVRELAQAVSAEGASLVRPTHLATVQPLALLVGSDASYDRKTVILNFASSAGKAGEDEYLFLYGSYAGGGIAVSSVEKLP